MTSLNFQPEDPRLTAYALGELNQSECTQVEALLAESAEARRALEGIRETVALLRSELTFEPALKLTSSQRETVAAATSSGFDDTVSKTQATMLSKNSRWGAFAGTVTTVAAVAAAAVIVPLISRSLQFDASRLSEDKSILASATPPVPSATEASIDRAELSTSIGADALSLESATSTVVLQPPDPEAESIAIVVAEKSALHDESVATASAPEGDGKEQQRKKSGEISMPEPQLVAGVSPGPDQFAQDLDGESERLQQRQKQPAKKGDLSESMESKGDSSVLLAELRSGSGEQIASGLEHESGQPGGKVSAGRELSFAAATPRYRVLEPEAKTRGLNEAGLENLSKHNNLTVEDSYQRLNARVPYATPGTEAYDTIIENVFLTPMEQPLSTFSIDVDTASYAHSRRFIQQGQLPPRNAVRIEELVNYFRYDYPEPTDGSPFSVNVDVATCPWAPEHKLARVGLKAKTIADDERPATNLVFLIDVSGSMAAQNKLPLVKQALSILVSKMGEDDQIAIVTYAGEAGLKLNSTSGSQQNVIQRAIDSLSSGGSTNGAAGINTAYETAIRSYIKGGANRVILCTDGDFNVGVSDDNTLVEMIQEKAASGVFLSVFGFGMGNLKDAKLEKLADKGNGNYGYIDGLQEARKVFSEQLSGTLITVAKDVKLQLEFDNSTVGAYRLIGYENRVLAAQDFDDDTKDAGEIGAGHTVTALYEIVPKAVWLSRVGLNPEKFDIVERDVEGKEATDGRLFTVKLRHKLPDAETSERSIDYAAMNSDVQLSDSSVDLRFAAAVASFGMQLRDSKFRGHWSLQNVLSTAEASLGVDHSGERTEFTDLVRSVMRIKGESVLDPGMTSQPAIESPANLPAELSANDARHKASVDGKYRRLLKKIEVRSDVASYSDFRDYGHWDGTSYSGHSDLPTGYWVWVYPNWYIWGDAAEVSSQATDDGAANSDAAVDSSAEKVNVE